MTITALAKKVAFWQDAVQTPNDDKAFTLWTSFENKPSQTRTFIATSESELGRQVEVNIQLASWIFNYILAKLHTTTANYILLLCSSMYVLHTTTGRHFSLHLQVLAGQKCFHLNPKENHTFLLFLISIKILLVSPCILRA